MALSLNECFSALKRSPTSHPKWYLATRDQVDIQQQQDREQGNVGPPVGFA
jgi:hypothetical protein